MRKVKWEREAIYTADEQGSIIAEVRVDYYHRRFFVTRRDFSPTPQPLPQIGDTILMNRTYKRITAITSNPDGVTLFEFEG